MKVSHLEKTTNKKTKKNSYGNITKKRKSR